MPNDRDLKAGYCLRIYVIKIQRQNSLLENLDKSILSKQDIDKYIEELELYTRSKNRLLSYIDARFSGDLTPIMSAVPRANEDEQLMQNCARKCMEAPIDKKLNIKQIIAQVQTCSAECDQNNGFPKKRVKSCDDLSFLPY
jgi:hypothetical protein